VFTHEVAKRLVRRGYDLTLFTSQFSDCLETEQVDAVRIIRKGGKYSVYNKAKAYYLRNKNNIGLVLFTLGWSNETVAVSDKALSIDPNNVDALNNKGLALADMNEYNQAVALFDQVLAIDPNNTIALDNKRLVVDATK
jgi:tetratricopeptide (TPR) repeat protein